MRGDGGPFIAWATVFERTADRIRARFEPRFPHVHPHRLRHSFSMRTLEYLVSGHYRQAAKLVRDTDTDAALVFYLTKADPLLVLRDTVGPLHRPDHGKVLETTLGNCIRRESFGCWPGARPGIRYRVGRLKAAAGQEICASHPA